MLRTVVIREKKRYADEIEEENKLIEKIKEEKQNEGESPKELF